MTTARSFALPPLSPDRSRAERLADVYSRAERLQRQRRTRLSTGALVGSLAVFLIALMAGNGLDPPQEVRTSNQPAGLSTTPTEPPSTTTTSTVADLPSEAGPEKDLKRRPREEIAAVDPASTSVPTRPRSTSTTAMSEPEPSPETSTTVLLCRNSHDPACGPFYFDPTPVNQPMVVEVTYSPENPQPGEQVTFTVRVRDDGPAGPGRQCGNFQSYGKGELASGVCSVSCVPLEPKYGPWDPPPPANTDFEDTFRYTYSKPGTYIASFSYNPLTDDCGMNPYHSQGRASVNVQVR